MNNNLVQKEDEPINEEEAIKNVSIINATFQDGETFTDNPDQAVFVDEENDWICIKPKKLPIEGIKFMYNGVVHFIFREIDFAITVKNNA